MRAVPLPAALLGAAGLLPFLWGAACALVPALNDWAYLSLGGRFTAPYVAVFYGVVILCFMSGVLWGFAARDAGARWHWYALSVLPALWAFFFSGGGGADAARAVIAGFLALLLLDWLYQRAGLAPGWWLTLRIPLTAIVTISLGLVAALA
ncbi:DUF3429 domain-containing protein [Roseicyclus sp. F158]|uniref:DUF3429 domain-containing protein n=1 Tax=Tropicimonas omnivorans TaxID=3075590 RepID=A0ABU3DCH9_9RHOB|nr:DUF3429 domain-containing protein [Roseicyclus sp. F158]MDT0681412.1 DUF3429 domain-containing protein [Roseicyclus sp. F158]